MESKAILFHSNKKEECDKFISSDDYLSISNNNKDDIWLGKGMYFWDNRGNANWWNNKQRNKYPDKDYQIVVANANLERLLDLTDFDIYMKIEELWKSICKKARLNPNVPLGNKLNHLFEVEKFNFIYSIIKVYGKYNWVSNAGLFKFDYKSMNAEPTIAVKCIYSIRDSKCILEREYAD